MEEKIQQIFKDNKLYYDWDVVIPDSAVEIHVEWGDWKHDHLHLKWVMEQNGFIYMGQNTTEEDGSDTYSADHIYIYKH